MAENLRFSPHYKKNHYLCVDIFDLIKLIKAYKNKLEQ